MSETLVGDEWVKRILGISPVLPETEPSPKQVLFTQTPVEITPPKGNPIQIGNRSRSNAVIKPPPPPTQPKKSVGDVLPACRFCA